MGRNSREEWEEEWEEEMVALWLGESGMFHCRALTERELELRAKLRA